MICSLAGGSKRLILQEPSTVGAANSVLRDAAKSIGLLAKIESHDIRRGAALEYAHLPLGPLNPSNPLGPLNPSHSLGSLGSYRTSALESARYAMNHSIRAMNDGTTAEYIGTLRVDTWKHIANKTLPASAKHTLDRAEPFRPVKKRSTREIDEGCNARGVNPEASLDRSKVRRVDFKCWLHGNKSTQQCCGICW